MSNKSPKLLLRDHTLKVTKIDLPVPLVIVKSHDVIEGD